jgi:hypothetical protein
MTISAIFQLDVAPDDNVEAKWEFSEVAADLSNGSRRKSKLSDVSLHSEQRKHDCFNDDSSRSP